MPTATPATEEDAAAGDGNGAMAAALADAGLEAPAEPDGAEAAAGPEAEVAEATAEPDGAEAAAEPEAEVAEAPGEDDATA